jgi:DNA-binding CsgD family transcriptional regulator
MVKLSAEDLDELDDFDSEDFDEDEDDEEEFRDERNSYIGNLWGRYGYTVGGRVNRDASLVTAHKMVQTFVDTFDTSDVRYRVAFSEKAGVAGTDFNAKLIMITPAPAYDTHLSPQEAGILMTAMAVHEVSHVRYGRNTYLAVKRIFGPRKVPHTLSNLLDDVRIERRFVADYPGYASVFRPMLEYVALAQNKKRSGASAPYRPKLEDPVNLAIAAIRYSDWATWPTRELREERDWWREWAERWAREDAPRRHVEGVREGLRRVASRRRRGQRRAANDRVARVQRNMGRLSPIAREALRLAAAGRTGPEIAAELDLPVEDARRLLASARRHLAEEGK